MNQYAIIYRLWYKKVELGVCVYYIEKRTPQEAVENFKGQQTNPDFTWRIEAVTQVLEGDWK